jgi:hypothetical protein
MFINISKIFNIGLDSFEAFEVKTKNLRKVNIINKYGNVEGIWAFLTDKDCIIYDSDTPTQEYSIAVCDNDTLMGIPAGAYLPIKFMGSNRPICYVDDFMNRDVKMIMNENYLKKYSRK